MLIQPIYRMIIYDMMLIISLGYAGYSIGIKLYVFGVMFIVVAFFVHSRLTRMLELKEDKPLGLYPEMD